MKSSKIVTAVLCALLLLVLARNFQYLYVAPVQNAYWWSSDETWLMSQYHEFVTTGHYVNPDAPGSAFSQCSGLLFGSCYLTAMLYGLPLLLIKGHTIDVGRTISFAIGLVTLLSIWVIAKGYGVKSWLRIYGCVLLASTLCFFVMSHSARYDMLVGLAVMVCVAGLPLVIKRYANLSLILGLSFPFCFLLNGHVFIYLFLGLAYMSYTIRPNLKIFFCSMFSGFLVLFGLQVILLHSVSFFGPLSDGLNKIPAAMILHPKSDFANFYWRYYIANMWAQNILFLSFVLIPLFIIAIFRHKVKLSDTFTTDEECLASGAALVIISSVFLEDVVTPRYFIHVLPTIVFIFIVMLSILFRMSSGKLPLALVLTMIGAFSIYEYAKDTNAMGKVGEIISRENKQAMSDALIAIHSRDMGSIPRVFCTVSGQSVVMDDDSCKLITTVMYNQPIDNLPEKSVWKNAKIDYAIKYSGHWSEKNSFVDLSTNPKMIFERAGLFTDFSRDYDLADLKSLDTLRVYEFK